MRLSPLRELLVASEHRVDYLIEHVLGRFTEELRVRIQRLVVLGVESCAVFHELLTARARLDQWHSTLRPGRSDDGGHPSRGVVRDERASRFATRHCVVSTTSARSRLSGQNGYAAGA